MLCAIDGDMNDYITQELTTFLEHANKGELTSLIVAATTTGGEVLAAWEVHDFRVLGAVEYIKQRALTDVVHSTHEKDDPNGDKETEVETIQDPLVREARSEASQEDGENKG